MVSLWFRFGFVFEAREGAKGSQKIGLFFGLHFDTKLGSFLGSILGPDFGPEMGCFLRPRIGPKKPTRSVT